MKDGRPSLVYDIRYFLEPYQPLPEKNVLEAYGRRVAWLLNSEGVSLGAFSHVYIYLSTSIAQGEVKVSDEANEWWYQSITVGTKGLLPLTSDALQTVGDATVAALLSTTDVEDERIRRADMTARDYGENVRFLVKSRRCKKYDLNISTTIADDPGNLFLVASVVEHDTGREAFLPPLCFGIYRHSFDDAAAIGIRDIEISSTQVGDLEAKWSDKFQKGRSNIVQGFDQRKPFFQSKQITRQR